MYFSSISGLVTFAYEEALMGSNSTTYHLHVKCFDSNIKLFSVRMGVGMFS